MDKHDVAIIGIDCKIAGTTDKNEFWLGLQQGKDFIRDIPLNRLALFTDYYKVLGKNIEDISFINAGYMNNIDFFDNEYFNISPFEAKLMSPEQKIFLQSTCAAIEDAGYAISSLYGSKTGIFVGHSTDFNISYKEFIKVIDETLTNAAIPGNINSLIAGRVSHILNLRGPAILLDTACSSSLTAIIEACNALREGVCDMAIAGAVKIELLPSKELINEEDIGIISSSFRTKAFDDKADGTGLGEGVGTILLKPLENAINDNDNIYAVIKGYGINHDGRSIGLTAPNAESQKEVIIQAWNDSNIDPTTISYIETHGTGTKLGDPLEIEGISQAFYEFTDKLQFCGIGSVKSNIGHLDNAAGIASIMKVILSLYYSQLPATINIKDPNKFIDFKNSPVYINRNLKDWTVPLKRCGVSAFGLSGTNCHIVLENHKTTHTSNSQPDTDLLKILTLSAKSFECLISLSKLFFEHIRLHDNLDLSQLIFVQNTGRDHYSYRLAIIFESRCELLSKLENFIVFQNENSELRIYYYYHNIVQLNENMLTESDISVHKRDMLTKELNEEIICRTLNKDIKNMTKLANRYTRGATVKWEKYYNSDEKYKKMPLPTYPFSNKSCWIKCKNTPKNHTNFVRKLNTIIHPLLTDDILLTYDRIICKMTFSEKQWFVKEHIVAGSCVVTGTTFIEIILEIMARYIDINQIEFHDVTFLRTLTVKEQKEAQIIISASEYKDLYFEILSKEDISWTKNAVGHISISKKHKKKKKNIIEIKNKKWHKNFIEYNYGINYRIDFGERWECVASKYNNKDKYFAKISLNKKYLKDLEYHKFHPATFDSAVNFIIRCIGPELYLPFSYKVIEVYEILPAIFYSYIYNFRVISNKEFAIFDIDLIGEDGNILLSIKEYKVKKASNMIESSEIELLHKIEWEEQIEKCEKINMTNSRIAVFTDSLNPNLKASSSLTLIKFAKQFNIISNSLISIRKNNPDDYYRLAQYLYKKKIIYILHLASLTENKDNERDSALNGLYSLIYLHKAISKMNITFEMYITIITKKAYACLINEETIPINTALLGLIQSMNSENSRIVYKGIDINETTDFDLLKREMFLNIDTITSLRCKKRYIRKLVKYKHCDVSLQKTETIKENGVYIITGGLGGIGLEIANSISKRKKVNIVIISKSRFSSKDTLGGSNKHKKKMEKIKRIEAMGSNIDLYYTDLSDYEGLLSIVNELSDKYSKINGIFHCAGKAASKILQLKSISEIEEVLNPKIYGTYNIVKAIINSSICNDIDYFVNFSSVSSFMSAPGQSDYIAANSYLDSFANQSNMPYININWCMWNEVGMAVDYKVNVNESIFNSISTEVGLKMLFYILETNITNVVVGKLRQRLFDEPKEKCVILLPKAKNTSIIEFNTIFNSNINTNINTSKESDLTNFEKVELVGKKNEFQYTESEKIIASIIANVLELTTINLNKSFLELGGNSIIAVQLEVKMRENNIPIYVTDLYNYKTIIDLAKLTEKKRTDIGKAKKIDKDSVINMNEYGINSFNDLLYKNCFYNALFTALWILEKDTKIFMQNDSFIYYFNKKDYQVSFGMKNIVKFSIAELLSFLNIDSKLLKHDVIKEYNVKFSAPIGANPIEDIIDKLDEVKNPIIVSHNDIISDLNKSLKNNSLVILWVDAFYEEIREDAYKKKHILHALLVYNYDKASKTYSVIEQSDSNALDYSPQKISALSLKKSYIKLLKTYNFPQNFPTFFEIRKSNIQNDSILLDFFGKKDMIVCLNNLKLIINYISKKILSNKEIKQYGERIIDNISNIINNKKVEIYILNIIEDINEDNRDILLEKWIFVRKEILRLYYGEFRSRSVIRISEMLSDILSLEEKLE